MSMYNFDVLCMKLKTPIDNNSSISNLSKVWSSKVSSTLAAHRINQGGGRARRVKGNGENDVQ